MLGFDNTFGIITAECDEDNCAFNQDYEGFDGCDLESALFEMKEDGWLIENINGDWFHTCPTCTCNLRK